MSVLNVWDDRIRFKLVSNVRTVAVEDASINVTGLSEMRMLDEGEIVVNVGEYTHPPRKMDASETDVFTTVTLSEDIVS